MARVSRIGIGGKLEVCKAIGFERNDLWTEILGRIPSLPNYSEAPDAEPDSEYILQRLIEFYPQILPWHEFRETADGESVPVCVVCNEASPTLATDILLVERTDTGSGRFVIVETKLVKNAEIYRAVVGQVLEYAAKLSTTKREELEERARNYWRGRPNDFGGTFDEHMTRAFSEDWRNSIWRTALENLRRGNLRLLIVGDRIPEELRLAVTFLPSSVLLSSVEIQCHQGSAGDGKLVTGVESARAIGVESVQSGFKEYLARVQVSVVQLKLTESGSIVSEAVGSGRTSSLPRGRPYEDHLDKLGGPKTVPGHVLEMLREKARSTNGYVAPGKSWLTFGWWNLPGLYAQENGGAVAMQFGPLGPVDNRELPAASREELRTASREAFLRHFRDEVQLEHGAYIDLRPIAKDADREKAEHRVHALETLYAELQELRQRHGARPPTPQDPNAEDSRPEA
jgi:hypothetical protein